jgi:hypothetical protein
MVAVRDVIAGEEITCDYTLFEYDCTDKAIFECACGAGAQCLRDVRGFKFLTRAQQVLRCYATTARVFVSLCSLSYSVSIGRIGK